MEAKRPAVLEKGLVIARSMPISAKFYGEFYKDFGIMG